jgi:Dolichyl-phosphate-mannose-protein mannosyltransferase
MFRQADRASTGVAEDGAADRPARTWSRLALCAEALGVLLSPAIVVLVLRVRLMAPANLADPAISTGYVVDPQNLFARYGAAFAATARMRDAADVGFLVPARVAYLLFGAVHGFFVFRYVLALVAIVPVYLLLRRVYHPAAGVVGILAVLTSPVILTAWGTDYPNASVVSYAAGAIACLAMPSSSRWRRAWLAAAGVLLVLAVWSHGVAVPLAAATLVAWLVVRLVRERAGLVLDIALLAGIAVAVTGLLVVASGELLGHANFISLTWRAYRYLSQPDQIAHWHAKGWAWAAYVTYLLVPPAVLAALAVAAARRPRAVPTAVLQVGAIAFLQLAVYAYLQFFGTVQTLEQYFFSSTLWAATCLALAITVAELGKPLFARPVARWLPAAVLLAVPLGYEAHRHVSSFRWVPAGLILMGVMIIAAAAGRAAGYIAGRRLVSRLAAAAAVTVAIAVLTAVALVLTVAPVTEPKALTYTRDPAPAYAGALGGNAALLIDNYRITTEIPPFVGPGYPGEQLLMWSPRGQVPFPYLENLGIFHAYFNSLTSKLPALSTHDVQELMIRKPAEILLLDSSAGQFSEAVANLAAYRPLPLRSATLRSGPLVLHVLLIRLRVFYHPPRA